jgi:3D-(3,5/4)-trihydroxycyclohexane-1,2-dione acylhydrolase (decyclizing)
VAERTVRLTAAQALVRYLSVQHSERDGRRQRVIPRTFGIFGHGNVCGLGEALTAFASAMPFHQPKHEQAMVHTALGYAKATRRLSTFACTASIGPGATNLVTGAATATVNRLPVLLLPADTFASRRQGPVLQQLQHPASADWSVNETLRPVSRFFDRISRPEQLLDALPEAIRVLLDPASTGAVTLALYQDVQGEAFHCPERFLAPRTWSVRRGRPAREEVAAAAALLRGAERPLIIVGGGVRHSEAEAAVAALAGARGIPLAETSAGKGACQVPLHLGGIGVNGTGAAAEIARRADVVVCAGTRLTDFTTASRSLFGHPDVRFAGINVDPADAARLGGVPVVGDARECVAELDDALGDWATGAAYREEVRRAVDAWDERVDAAIAGAAGPLLSQAEALRTVNRAAGPGDWVVAAAGSPPGDLLKLWRAPTGSATHIEFGFSCMGHELPAALGIRMAQPEHGRVIAVIGDGTYLMAPTELVTAVQESLAVTVIVLVNGGFQSIHGLQRGSVAHSLGNEFRVREPPGGALDGPEVGVDYAASARSFGCAAWDVDSAAALEAALREAAEVRGPAVIACRVAATGHLPPSGAWWDLGVPEVSDDEAVTARAAEQRAGAAAQRWYG